MLPMGSYPGERLANSVVLGRFVREEFVREDWAAVESLLLFGMDCVSLFGCGLGSMV